MLPQQIWHIPPKEEQLYSGRPTETSSYIGLMYPSDYGYAVLSSTCQRTKALYNYYSSGCYNQNWLHKVQQNGL